MELNSDYEVFRCLLNIEESKKQWGPTQILEFNSLYWWNWIVWAIRMIFLFPLCPHILFLFPRLSFINPLKYKIFDLGKGYFSNHTVLFFDSA